MRNREVFQCHLRKHSYFTAMNTGREPMGPQTQSLLSPWLFILQTRWATALVSGFVLSSAYCSEGSGSIYHCSCALKKTFSLIQNIDHLHISTQHSFPYKTMKCLWDWDFTWIPAKTKKASASVHNSCVCSGLNLLVEKHRPQDTAMY